MSQLRCDNCDRLWSDFAAKVGERCGVRLSPAQWCDGKLVVHEAPPAWLDAPDGPGWWWAKSKSRYGVDHIRPVEVCLLTKGLCAWWNEGGGSSDGWALVEKWAGVRQWQRVAPPREG